MMVLLFYFLIAAVAVLAAPAIIGLFLTNLIMNHFENPNRVSRWINLVPSRAKIERHTNHPRWRFNCFSRRQTQARLAGVLIRRT